MQTSVETINGKLCTIIRRPFDAEWVREQLAMGIPVVAWHRFWKKPVSLVNCYTSNDGEVFYQGWFNQYETFSLLGMVFTDTITILLALPRRLTPEHAPLLYRYCSEGIFAYLKGNSYPFPKWSIRDESGIFVGISEDVQGNVVGKFLETEGGWPHNPVLEYATDTNGNRIEVAIEGE